MGACEASPSPEGDSTCECERFEACVMGSCAPADTLLVRLSEGVSPRWRVCPIASGGHGRVERHRQGACAALELVHEPLTIADADFGGLTISGTQFGAVSSTVQNESDGCFGATEPVDRTQDVFEEGAMLVAEASGGEHFPFFSSAIEAPGSIFAVTSEKVVRQGEGIVVAWVSSASNREIVVRAHAPPILIHCEGLPDTGNFTIPGELSNYLPVGSFDLIVSAVSRQRFTPMGSEVGVEFQAQAAVAQQASISGP